MDQDQEVTGLRLKLHLIEQRLDNQISDRSERLRLSRRRDKIRRKLAGRDPMYFVGHQIGAIPPDRRKDYRTKKQVVCILDQIDETDG